MPEATNIKVGILITTFNRKTYLIKAFDSACAQSHFNLDIIVIDNGSTDGTAEFMVTVSDPRVRYVINDNNIGMIGSINKGINLFSDEVEWCAILSDDDLLKKDFVDNLLQSAISLGAKAIIHSHRIFIDQEGNKIREATLSPKEETALDYITMRSQFKRETYLTGVLFNRKAFQAIQGYPVFSTGLATDDAFIFAMALKDRLIFEQNAVAYIRIHEGAESEACVDGMKKLRTLEEYSDYCRKVARESGSIDQSHFHEFELSLRRHFRALSSAYWTKAVQCTVHDKNSNLEQLATLISLAKSNRHRFTFRIRFAVVCHTMTGIFPESYAGYRLFWEKIISAAAFLRKHETKP